MKTKPSAISHRKFQDCILKMLLFLIMVNTEEGGEMRLIQGNILEALTMRLLTEM